MGSKQCRVARGERRGASGPDTSVFGVLGNELAIEAILGRAWGLYSFEHGDTLPQEDGHGLLVEAGLY